MSSQTLTFRPVTTKEWPDLCALFDEPGPQSGCWCMYWRTKREECQRQFGEGNKRALQQIIESGKVPGLLLYWQGRPIAWCSVAPREDFPVLDRSPTLKRVDDEPVWSIVCFFVSKPYRRQNLTTILIKAAIAYAKDKGAKIIEAYPLILESTKYPHFETYMGVRSTFEKAGFKEVASRSKRRPIMRYYVQDGTRNTQHENGG